jgi:drug/metabolite transporter (DMT)-like permease
MSTLTTALLALAAAVLFSFGNQCSRHAMRYTDSQTAALCQIAIGTAFYWLTSPFYLHWDYWSSPVLPLLAAAGLLRPILSANLSMAGTHILGPTLASTLSATAPLFGVCLGVLLLAETLSWEVALGTGGIIAAIVVLSWRRHQHASWPLLALLLPIGAAFFRSLSHAISKVGLETLPSPFFVALVAYSVSLTLALANAARPSRRQDWSVRSGGFVWLLATGMSYGIAVLVVNSALLSGRLVVVSPLIACTPVFTLLLWRYLFRETALTARVVVAVFIVTPSVILIALRG